MSYNPNWQVTPPKLQVATVSLTDAQIKALPTTPVTIVAAPGGSLIVMPVLCFITCFAASGAYTNISGTSTMGLFWTGGTARRFTITQAAAALTGLFGTASANNNILPSDTAGSSAVRSDFSNRPVQLVVANAALGNFTGGNAANAAFVTVVYTILPI